MMHLAEYRTRPETLADYLPWAALVAPGVVLNKDGSLQRSARFRGPDLESATPAELMAVSARLNNALRRLGSGWAVFFEAERHAATGYPQSRFPRSGFLVGRRGTPRRFRTGGRALRERLSRHLRVPAAGRADEPRRAHAVGASRGRPRSRLSRRARRVRRPAPIACSIFCPASCRRSNRSTMPRP
jgi:hypothetical protein